MIEIVRYSDQWSSAWDALVSRSRNGTFLHCRAYMDYHRDRFTDCSLLAVDGDRLVTALPACCDGDVLYSHAGLTYGGWLLPPTHFDVTTMLAVMDATTQWMRQHGFARLVYKPVPHIFHRYPADDDLYALWRCGAVVTGCNVSTTIDLSQPIAMGHGCKGGLNVSRRAGVTVGRSDDWAAYWQLLEDVLRERHQATPVHTLDEMLRLRDCFPDNIHLYTATISGTIVAGIVTYTTHTVMHCQYTASGEQGRRSRALAPLIAHLIEVATKQGLRYLDFGTSNADQGHWLDEGLVQQKSQYGGRSIVFPTLTLTI